MPDGQRPSTPAGGWLADQLPRPLAEDPFTARFVGLFEEVAGTVRDRVDGIEHHLDPGLAPPAFVRWMARWIGVTLAASLPVERQRDVLRAAGPLLGWQGTRKGLEGLLAALTGGAVDISDGGGVYPSGQVQATDHHITVRLERAGGIDTGQLLGLVRAEVPADTTVDLLVDAEAVERERAVEDVDESETSVAAPEPLEGQGYLPPLRGGAASEPPDPGGA